MTIEEAFIELSNSEEFKATAKNKDSIGGKYRYYLSLFKASKLKTGALVDLLIANGYEIKAGKVEKKNGAAKMSKEK